jgi:two-component system, LytTR family, sensor kinase
MKHRRLLLHIAFWLVFGLYHGYLNAPMAGTSFEHLSLAERLMKGYLAELVAFVYKIPTTYFVLYVLVPDYMRRRNLWIFTGALVLITALVTVLSKTVWFEVIYPYIYKVSNPEPVSSVARQIFRWLWNSLDILLLLSVASALRFLRLSLRASARERVLREEKLQSELHFLRAQTNPHFLFNTLNNLYHLARKQSAQTPDAILKLADLLRFILYECTSDRIRIQQEIKVIEDYLALEKLRYGNRLRIDFQCEIDQAHQPIAPLLLLPFIENAFKHGVSEARGYTWVYLRVQLHQGQLQLDVHNPKLPEANSGEGGIGLKNIRRQLEITYPDHRLCARDLETRYEVHLELNLNAS